MQPVRPSQPSILAPSSSPDKKRTVPKADLVEAEQVAASLFFSAIFGEKAAKGLNILVVLSAFGNLVSVLIGQSRVIREIGRQGALPWPTFWASTRPFGTPIGPYLLKWGMTVLMIVAPPAGDAFNFGNNDFVALLLSPIR